MISPALKVSSLLSAASKSYMALTFFVSAPPLRDAAAESTGLLSERRLLPTLKGAEGAVEEAVAEEGRTSEDSFSDKAIAETRFILIHKQQPHIP